MSKTILPIPLSIFGKTIDIFISPSLCDNDIHITGMHVDKENSENKFDYETKETREHIKQQNQCVEYIVHYGNVNAHIVSIGKTVV